MLGCLRSRWLRLRLLQCACHTHAAVSRVLTSQLTHTITASEAVGMGFGSFASKFSHASHVSGTARVEQSLLQGHNNTASASSYCIGEDHGAYLCSARLLTYTLHVCVVCQRAERMNKQHSQTSCNCSRSGSILS